MIIPLFPLSNLVMPGGLLPLRLFEPRYIDMVKNCFKTDTGFGVCLIEEGHEVGSEATPYPRGTHVRIIDFDQGDDGLLHIMAEGVEEFLLSDFKVEPSGLLVGQVTLLASSPVTELPPQYNQLAAKLDAILRYVESHISYAEEHIDQSDWVCNRLMELLPLDAQTKYEMLLLPEVNDRLEALSDINFTIELG